MTVHVLHQLIVVWILASHQATLIWCREVLLHLIPFSYQRHPNGSADLDLSSPGLLKMTASTTPCSQVDDVRGVLRQVQALMMLLGIFCSGGRGQLF